MNATPEQVHILRHSLGLTRGEREYRNHFVAGGKDVEHCRGLVSLGLMHEHATQGQLSGGDPVFTVTDEGKAVARAHAPKKLSRGTRRWKYWLTIAEVFPDHDFGDFLKLPMFADSRARADGKAVLA